MYHKNAKAYRTNNLQAEMLVADPHRVIQLMMQGILERLAQAKGYISRREFEKKSECISSIIALLNGLQDSLDFKQSTIAEDLLVLYVYMKDRVLDASVQMDCAPLDEVANLLLTIKSAWDQIPESEKQKAYHQQKQGQPDENLR